MTHDPANNRADCENEEMEERFHKGEKGQGSAEGVPSTNNRHESTHEVGRVIIHE
jgi:hypothetical protein